MKHFICVIINLRGLLHALLLLAGSLRSFAQGQVDFSNGPCLGTPPDRLVRFAPDVPNPFGTNNAPLVGTNFFAQLYYGSTDTPEDSLTPVSLPPRAFRPTMTVNPGLWLPGTVTFTQYDYGAVVRMQVRVWDSTFGSTYEEVGPNGLQGRSLVFLHGFAFPLPNPCWDAMFNFQGFTVNYVPEPSSLPLFVGGGLCVFLLRRRLLRPP